MSASPFEFPIAKNTIGKGFLVFGRIENLMVHKRFGNWRTLTVMHIWTSLNFVLPSIWSINAFKMSQSPIDSQWLWSHLANVKFSAKCQFAPLNHQWAIRRVYLIKKSTKIFAIISSIDLEFACLKFGFTQFSGTN